MSEHTLNPPRTQGPQPIYTLDFLKSDFLGMANPFEKKKGPPRLKLSDTTVATREEQSQYKVNEAQFEEKAELTPHPLPPAKLSLVLRLDLCPSVKVPF